MLKAAIEKIQEMAAKPERFSIDGHDYIMTPDGGYTEIKPELEYPEQITLSSLDALIQFVKREALNANDHVFITIPNHETVCCFTEPIKDLRWNRVYLYTAKATDVPGWNKEVKMGFEEAMIALRTRFTPTPDTDYALRLLSSITTGGKVTFNDNGVATSIVTQKGIALQENTEIRPIVRLSPYRTFQEVPQPESQFLIRVSERAITIVEADGGMWKLQARRNIMQFLAAELAEEIESGKVVLTM